MLTEEQRRDATRFIFVDLFDSVAKLFNPQEKQAYLCRFSSSIHSLLLVNFRHDTIDVRASDEREAAKSLNMMTYIRYVSTIRGHFPHIPIGQGKATLEKVVDLMQHISTALQGTTLTILEIMEHADYSGISGFTRSPVYLLLHAIDAFPRNVNVGLKHLSISYLWQSKASCKWHRLSRLTSFTSLTLTSFTARFTESRPRDLLIHHPPEISYLPSSLLKLEVNINNKDDSEIVKNSLTNELLQPSFLPLLQLCHTLFSGQIARYSTISL